MRKQFEWMLRVQNIICIARTPIQYTQSLQLVGVTQKKKNRKEISPIQIQCALALTPASGCDSISFSFPFARFIQPSLLKRRVHGLLLAFPSVCDKRVKYTRLPDNGICDHRKALFFYCNCAKTQHTMCSVIMSTPLLLLLFVAAIGADALACLCCSPYTRFFIFHDEQSMIRQFLFTQVQYL